MPSAVTRAASLSWSPASSTLSSARAWPGREHAGRDASLHGRGQLQQPEGVGDLRPRPTDPLGELVVGAAEVLEQLAVGRGLLERVELGAVEVLQQRVPEHVVVVGLPHDRGDRVEAGLLRRTPAALAHDQLVLVGRLSGARRPAGGARPPGSSARARRAPPPRRPGGAAGRWGAPARSGARRSRRRRRCRRRRHRSPRRLSGPSAGRRAVGAGGARWPRPATRSAGWGRSGSASRARVRVHDEAGGVHAGSLGHRSGVRSGEEWRGVLMRGLPWWRSRGRPRGRTARRPTQDRRSSRSGRRTAPRTRGPSAARLS